MTPAAVPLLYCTLQQMCYVAGQTSSSTTWTGGQKQQVEQRERLQTEGPCCLWGRWAVRTCTCACSDLVCYLLLFADITLGRRMPNGCMLFVCHLCVRARAALEESLIAEEVERLLSEYVEARVRDVLASQHVQASLAQRLQVSSSGSGSGSRASDNSIVWC
jgi:hypothetical protein